LWRHRASGIPGECDGPGAFGGGSPYRPDRYGSTSDPSLNGHLRYPNDIERSLNETVDDKIRKYRADYNNNPPNIVSFMSAIASTSGRLHSEFVRLLFLQAHRETDRFFSASGVQLAQTDRGQFHFRRAAFSTHLKSRVGLPLAKAAALRITLTLDGSPIISKSHTHGDSPITLANFSSINLVFILRYSSSSIIPVYAKHVDSSSLGFSLSSHRQSYIVLVFELSLYRLIINNNTPVRRSSQRNQAYGSTGEIDVSNCI
jgi:hypothetical protein